MSTVIIFPNIGPNQAQTMGVDFGKFLPSGVTLTGTPTINVTALNGLDASPNSRISGGPSVGTISTANNGTGNTNTSVLYQISGCTPGETYQLDIYCTRSDGDRAESFVRFSCAIPS